MISKKGQGLPLNIVVIAAIALIVLVVLIAIFSGRLGKFGKGVEETAGEIKCPDEDKNMACKPVCGPNDQEVLAKTSCLNNPVDIHCCIVPQAAE